MRTHILLTLLAVCPCALGAEEWSGKVRVQAGKLFVGERELLVDTDLARQLARDVADLVDTPLTVRATAATDGLVDELQLRRGKFSGAWQLEAVVQPRWRTVTGVLLPEHDRKVLKRAPDGLVLFPNEVDVHAVRGPLQSVLRRNLNRRVQVGGWFDRGQRTAIVTEAALGEGAWLRAQGDGHARRVGETLTPGSGDVELGSAAGEPTTMRGTVTYDPEFREFVLRTPEGYVRLLMEAWAYSSDDVESPFRQLVRAPLTSPLELCAGREVVLAGVLERPEDRAPVLLVSQVISPQRCTVFGTVEHDGLRVLLRVGEQRIELFDHDPANNRIEGRSWESRRLAALLAQHPGELVNVRGRVFSDAAGQPQALLPESVRAMWPVSQRSIYVTAYDLRDGRASLAPSSESTPFARDLRFDHTEHFTPEQARKQEQRLTRLVEGFRAGVTAQ